MDFFSIKDIERLTGIRAHTLRIWEQRFNFPQPKRTATNIRYYDHHDLQLLLNVSTLKDKGIRISSILSLSPEEICNKAAEFTQSLDSENTPRHMLRCAMMNLDEKNFDKILSNCIIQKGMEYAMMDVVFPFLQSVGSMWQTNTVSPSYEHFASNIIRNKLIVASDTHHSYRISYTRNFILLLPDGELHEIGLLFANYMVRAAGHKSLYLGQSTTLDDIRGFMNSFPPDYWIISLTSTINTDSALRLIRTIEQQDAEARILLTGNLFTSEHPKSWKLNHPVIRQPEDLKKLLH
ncbi:MAG: MerR family transcriptional regulator [Bacteroidetes bacterium]|nr:MAG: MerR family transcriptional regulator [Bacteroidota bacterium]REK35196.1 MAG: MerR family transcriptional regulator [Bacteroidota bacterium]REK48273.1 MAG: MerR family transcriptional regulator [Bacteroidota bacterium]